MASLVSSIGRLSDGLVTGTHDPDRGHNEQNNLSHSYRELLEALPTAIYTTDAQGRITFYNQAAVDLAGRRPVAGSDQWCVSWRLFWPDGRPMAHDECPMAIALKQDRPVRGTEAIIERPDGTRVPILPYPTPLHDRSGRLIGAVNMLVDITDSKIAEQALRRLNTILEQNVEEQTEALKLTSAKLTESERDLRMLVQSVTDYAIFMLDTEGTVVSWNAGAERIKGYTAEEIIGQHFSRFYTDKDRAEGVPQRALATAVREGKFEAEGWRLRKDGQRFWASVVIDPVRDGAGRLVGFAKITRDITERRAAQQSLAESAELARGIIETALDGFVQIDDSGTVREWNPQAEKIFGWSRQEAVGKSLDTLILPTRERERHRRGVAEFLLTGVSRILDRRVQMQALRRDGKEITVELSVTSLKRGDRYLFNGFIRDLTEKLAAEEQLHHALKMETIGQLTGGVAHDFNNLLTAIIGNLEVLAAKLPDQGSAFRYLDAALRAAWRGSGLTEQLVAFSRPQEIRPKIVSVDRLMRDMTTLCQKTVGEGIEIVLGSQPNLWTCRLDPGQFEAALLNLAANARDAMDGSGRLTIAAENIAMGARDEIELPPGEYVAVSVADTGCGMSKKVIARAFEPFYTTKEAGKGTGLGLAQVYGFVKQCGGIARIKSKLAKGTTICLYFPRAKGDVEPEMPWRALPHALRGNTNVLIVEDNVELRELATELLSHLGYGTVAVGNGQDALRELQRDNSVQVLISDILLPGGVSGLDLARAARKLNPDLKILLNSGYMVDESRLALTSEAFEFIAKPFRPAELATKLSEILADREG
ncbi:MAG: PAS domain S-box protein [Alphaproteobacteria bacterium]|nr:PAS domain S-box protein [Alphaproteobacteria bacterium]